MSSPSCFYYLFVCNKSSFFGILIFYTFWRIFGFFKSIIPCKRRCKLWVVQIIGFLKKTVLVQHKGDTIGKSFVWTSVITDNSFIKTKQILGEWSIKRFGGWDSLSHHCRNLSIRPVSYLIGGFRCGAY